MLNEEYKPVISSVIRALRMGGQWNDSGAKRAVVNGMEMTLGINEDNESFSLGCPLSGWSVSLIIVPDKDNYKNDYAIGNITGNEDACIRDLIFMKMSAD